MKIYYIFSALIILFFWSFLIYGLGLPPYIFPSPIQVVSVFIHQPSLLAYHAFISLVEIVLGFLLAILCSMTTVYFLDLYKNVQRSILPIMITLQSIPLIALMPLLVIWFGHGLFPKIFIITLSCYFPIALALYDGLKRTPKEWMDLSQLLHADKKQLLKYVRFPYALPSLFSGLRIAGVHAPVTVLTADWIGAESGLGYLIMLSGGRIDLDLMFACIILLICLSFLFYVILNKLERKILFWLCK